MASGIVSLSSLGNCGPMCGQRPHLSSLGPTHSQTYLDLRTFHPAGASHEPVCRCFVKEIPLANIIGGEGPRDKEKRRLRSFFSPSRTDCWDGRLIIAGPPLSWEGRIMIRPYILRVRNRRSSTLIGGCRRVVGSRLLVVGSPWLRVSV